MVRQERIANSGHSIFLDCRFALRQFRKSPGFAVTAVLTLALGIGSATAIFSVINGVLLNPYPYKGAERLATFAVFSDEQVRAWRFPAAAFVDFRQQNHTFDDMFGLVWREVHFARTGGTDDLSGASATPGTFASLGIPPLLGRPLTDEDARPGAPPVFVISYRLWTKLFHRDPKILGSTQTLNGQGMTLVGIMPPRFQIGGFDLWMPLNITRDNLRPRRWNSVKRNLDRRSPQDRRQPRNGCRGSPSHRHTFSEGRPHLLSPAFQDCSEHAQKPVCGR
jgi:putative ABC transport system permease protein